MWSFPERNIPFEVRDKCVLNPSSDALNSYFLLQVISDGVTSLQEDTTSEYGHTYLKGTKVIRGHYLKGIGTDSSNLFLWHCSIDIDGKALFPKFKSIPTLRYRVMLDFVFYIGLTSFY